MSILGQSTTTTTPNHASKLLAIKHVLATRRYQLITLVFAAAYAISYMLILGIISYYPGLSSITNTYPVFRVTSYGISIIPVADIYIFVFYQTIAFIMVSSFFVGINVALIYYSRKLGKICGLRSINVKSIFGIIPTFFTSFACCGGGLLALVIGPAAFSSLALYSKYMAPLTIAVLAIGTFLMSRKISKIARQGDNIDFCCYRKVGES
ncbi:MAG: hypothetical protein ACRD5J_09200 [Nitrososphaeraceae archaeon]